MYFNEERKMTYFQYLEGIKENSTKCIGYIFARVSKTEEVWEKDVCDFTVDEIYKLLPTFNSCSVNALNKNVSILRLYTEWCCQNKLSKDNINHFNEIDKSQLQPYVNKITSILPTKEEISDIVASLANASDKFLIQALYEGVKDETIGEFFYIPIASIDPDKRIITFASGKQKIMSKKLYYLAIESSEEEKYLSIKDDGDFFESTLTKKGTIINSRSNSTSDTLDHCEKRLRERMKKLKSAYDLSMISMPKLFNAGLRDEIKRIMEKYNINKEQFFNGKVDGKAYSDWIQEVNPNFEATSYLKVQIRTRVFEYLD